ncbi:MAG TPA: MBOAT family protein [Polyangiaceae bacterium]
MNDALFAPLVFGNVIGAIVAPRGARGARNVGRSAAALACGAAGVVGPHFVPEYFAIVRTVLAFATTAAFFRLVEILRHPESPLGARVLATAFPVVGVRSFAPHAAEARLDDFIVGGLFASFAIALFLVAGTFPPAAPYSGLPSAMRTLVGGTSAYFMVDAGARLTRATFAALGFDPGRLHDAPILARSVTEFWGRRWNRTIHVWLDENAFRPAMRAARRRTRNRSLSLAAGVLAAFGASAILHGVPMLVVYPSYAAPMTAFFLLHGLIVVFEARLGVARWPALAAHAWTLGIFALTAPLFVEPLLRAMGK